jgi:hypothetical protein
MYCLFNCEVGLADKYVSVSNLCAFGRRKITLCENVIIISANVQYTKSEDVENITQI